VFAVVADGATLVRRNAGVLAGVLMPALALAVALPMSIVHLAPLPAASGAFTGDALTVAIFAAAVLCIAVPWALASLAAIRVCLDDLEGRRPGAMAALADAARRLPAAMALLLATATGMAAGALLFIWPALYLAVIWSLSLVVLAAENLTLWQALRRSARLVAGNGWRVLALLFGWAAFSTAASVTVEAATGPDSLLLLVAALCVSTIWSVLAVALYGRRMGLSPQPLRPSAPFSPAAPA
jgi:hypothetical protein